MRNIFKNKMWFMALLLVVAMTGCGGSNDDGGGVQSTGAVCVGGDCVPLGTAGDLATAAGYAILANTGIDSVVGSPTMITGNIGVGPGVTSSAITGFSLSLPAASPFSTSVLVSGKVYAADYAPPSPSNVNLASISMGAAYDNAAARTATSAATTDVGGGTLTSLTFNAVPGGATVYQWGSAVDIPTDLTFNGSSTDVFILKVAGTLDMAAAKSVILTGGVLPQNIFWQVSDVVTIGANTHFEGIILGMTAINFGDHASINGRLFAQTAVNINATTVTQP